MKIVDRLLEICAKTGFSNENIASVIVRKMSDHKVDFTKKWEYSDVTFKVEDEEVHASKIILMMWSPVFKAMFENNFKEKEMTEIPLPGKLYNDVIEWMKVLHPPCHELSKSSVKKIIPLAHEYQMEDMLESCEEFLLSQSCSIENLLLAQKYDLKKVEEDCICYLKATTVSRLKQSPDFAKLDQQFVMELLMDKCAKLEDGMEKLRDVRMVIERKKPTTFPGIQLLCESCIEARKTQVDCESCLKSCCQRITQILRDIDR